MDWSCSRGGTSEDRGAWSWTDSASMAMGREEEEPSLDIVKDEWEKTTEKTLCGLSCRRRAGDAVGTVRGRREERERERERESERGKEKEKASAQLSR